jgi:electron transport complex protein RnfE
MPTKSLSGEYLKGLWDENPVFRQLLGMCPVLAVTNAVINGIAMGLATSFVLILSSLVVASIKRFIPDQVRIASYIVVIDALGMSTGFVLALLVLSSIREVLGAGTFLGYQVMGPWFTPWIIMILPAGAFITLGVLLGIALLVEQKTRERRVS